MPKTQFFLSAPSCPFLQIYHWRSECSACSVQAQFLLLVMNHKFQCLCHLTSPFHWANPHMAGIAYDFPLGLWLSHCAIQTLVDGII